MDAIVGIGGILLFLAALIWLIVSLIRRQPKKIPALAMVLGLVLFSIGLMMDPSDSAEPPAVEAEADTEQEELEPIEEEPAPAPAPEPEPEPVFDPTLYQNGITYDNLARNPDENLYSLVAFNGEVVQVIEGDGIVQCRFAIDGDYDRMILIEYDPSILDSRVLEGDYMTIYGMSSGIYTYQSTMGGPISVPGVLVTTIKY